MAPSLRETKQPPCLQSEKDALLTFKQAVTESYNGSWVWDNTTSCCSWMGVTCTIPSTSHTWRVTSLSLPSLTITGSIPPSISSLAFLHTLNLSLNRFSGVIPAQFASFSRLKTLDLSNNHLSGSLSVLSSIPTLQFINVSDNEFGDHLPALQNLTGLQELQASGNYLSGAINPVRFCQYVPALRVIDLSSNKFSGPLSLGFGSCADLQWLSLSFNELTGPIPQDLYTVTSLSTLYLMSNNLSGALDASVGNLTSLTLLYLANNQLFGPLPKTLSQNTKLMAVDLSRNRFTATLDVDFANLTLLEELNLKSNFFTGTIPASLGSCKLLRFLKLAVNNFNGSIPTQMNSLQSLMFVSLSKNGLNGSLQAFENCHSLVTLALTRNFFMDPLPPTFDGFANVQLLALGYLNLRGSIPAWLQKCNKLQVLDLSWNHLEGELPPWLGDFPHLVYLELSNNSFGGTIPPQLFKLPALVSKDNNTTGMQTITNLIDVHSQNGPPDLTYGRPLALPPSILLCNNLLMGEIPSNIHHLKMLLVLDLSHNHLTGTIPTSLANIVSLESLDLSYNHLTGSIPNSLTNLTFLSTFNASYNNLSGPIPLRNQFGTFSSSNYEGNPGLCGVPILTTCTINGSGSTTFSAILSYHHTRKNTRKAAVSVVCIGGGIAISLGLLLWMLSRKTYIHQGSESTMGVDDPLSLSSEAQTAPVQLLFSHEELTIADILRGTNNFDPTHIIGRGGFGIVYRADLQDGSKLAVKKLRGDRRQMEREFQAEVKALAKARHRNLVPLMGFLHIGHTKFLLYSYMANGSLDYWLHLRSDGDACLDWPMRIRIARGAAAGLAYLHQVSNPRIVHRDIKSSNILLDETFEACLADFGLARLMMSNQTHVTTELRGTLGYIPPEYGQKCNATPKGDIYSFGVVLLELLTGKRPSDICWSESGDLEARVQNVKERSNSCKIFDKVLLSRGDHHETQLKQVFKIACLCINRDPSKRPSITDVVSLLDAV